MDSKLITEVVAALSQKTLTVEHAHMLKPWEMVLGGLVLPMLAEEDPSVKGTPVYAALTTRYSKEAVEQMFSLHEVEKIVEREVEKIVTVEVPVAGAPGQTIVVSGRTPTLHSTVKEEGKFRRLKKTINKVARKKHGLNSNARDAMNTWWNQNQRLTNTGDCKPVVDTINAVSGTCLSPSQFGGWISLLTRMVTDDLKAGTSKRSSRIASMKKRGFFTVEPMFSDRLVNEITDNYDAQRREDDIRAQTKAQMKAEAAQASTVHPATPA